MVNGKIDKDGKLYLPLLCSGEPTLNQDSSEGHQKVKKDIWERGNAPTLTVSNCPHWRLHWRAFVIWKVVFDIGMVFLIFSINKLCTISGFALMLSGSTLINPVPYTLHENKL